QIAEFVAKLRSVCWFFGDCGNVLALNDCEMSEDAAFQLLVHPGLAFTYPGFRFCDKGEKGTRLCAIGEQAGTAVETATRNFDIGLAEHVNDVLVREALLREEAGALVV